ESVFFEIWGYPMSYLEFFGTVAGGVAVWLAARANIWSWPIGLINVTLFFFLFFQVQLYPDMFLQAFFFVTNLMGWWRWAHPNPEEEDRKKELRISFMPLRQLLVFSSIGAVGTVLMGAFASNLHEWFPIVFGRASAFPYLDSFVTVMSIVATYLMIQKKVECWVVWIVVDIVATGLYFAKGIKFVGIEYLAFCFLAAFGLWKWMKEYKSYTVSG
nr:nicotinamide riboside transporter PnuC [Cyclobacteriaceae bacterium]